MWGLLFSTLILPTLAEDEWHLLIEPKFMHYDAGWPIVGSETAVLVPARYINGEVLPLRREEIAKMEVTRKKILESAPVTAAKVLEGLKPRYVRDANKVIQYAIIESDSPLTASAVLAPKFADLFEETLGADILVAIPNRNRIFVFPKLSEVWKGLSDVIVAEYQSSTTPVSREVYAVKDGKLIAIGSYR